MNVLANIKSAKKRIRVIERKTAKNKRIKTHLRETLKDLNLAIENNDKKVATEKLRLAEKKLFKAVAKGTIHKNNAARKVSRLTKAVNSMK